MGYTKRVAWSVVLAASAQALPALARAEPTMLAVAPVGSVLGIAPAGGSPAVAPPSSRPPNRLALAPTLQAVAPASLGDAVPATPGPAPRAIPRSGADGVAPPREPHPGRNLDRALRRQYRQVQPALRSCFVRASRRGLEPPTKLELTLAVSPEGAVQRVAFDSPATPALAACLQRWVGRFRFSPGERVELPLSVLFRGHAR